MPIESEPVPDPGWPATDRDFVSPEAVAQLVLGPAPAASPERWLREVPAACADDFAALGGPLATTVVAPARPAMAAVIRANEAFSGAVWPGDAPAHRGPAERALQPRHPTPPTPQSGDVPRALPRRSHPAGRVRQLTTGRTDRHRRAQAPQPLRHPCDVEDHFGGSSRSTPASDWSVMFASAAASIVVFLLGVIVFNRPPVPPADDPRAPQPSGQTIAAGATRPAPNSRAANLAAHAAGEL